MMSATNGNPASTVLSTTDSMQSVVHSYEVRQERGCSAARCSIGCTGWEAAVCGGGGQVEPKGIIEVNGHALSWY